MNRQMMTTTCWYSQVHNLCKIFPMSKKKHGGSVIGREYIYRDKQGGHERMYQDYLAENPTYGPSFFRRRLILFSHWIHSFLCIFVTIMFRILFNFFQV